MKSFEVEIYRLRIYCMTKGCMNPGAGQKSTQRYIKDFSEASKAQAIEAFKTGIRINATRSFPTEGQWKKTSKGWLCPECQ